MTGAGIGTTTGTGVGASIGAGFFAGGVTVFFVEVAVDVAGFGSRLGGVMGGRVTLGSTESVGVEVEVRGARFVVAG
jgi:hypothetical protein